MADKKLPLILHIDDEDSIRLSIQGFLEDHEYEVISAENGRIGLELFRTSNPDLVLVDLRMPEVDGLDVVSEVNKLAPETPVIVVSGTGVIADAVRAIQLGAWNFIEKPIQDMSVLLHAVSNGLERARLIRENRDYQENLEQKVVEQTKTLQQKHQELKNSEEFFRGIIENSSDVVLIINDAFRVIYESPSHTRIFGYSPGQIINKSFLNYAHKDDKDEIESMLHSIKAIPGQVENIKFRFRHSDESWRNVEGTATNLLMITSIKGFVINIKDITESMELQKQLSQAQKMESIGTLAGGIAHDFNNLLTVINGFSDFILMKLKENDLFHREISAIRKAGDRAKHLTRQILAFSRKEVYQPKIISINDVILDFNKMINRLIGEDIKIEINLLPNIPDIKADTSQIEQILINLIVNARDAINQKTEKASEKKITIETNQMYLDKSYAVKHLGSKEGLYVSFDVIDSGIGMTEENIQRIFEPFYTTKEKDKGTGLGLSMVYGIVKQNDGDIIVTSTPGIGSAFRILWPIAVEKPDTDTKEKAHESKLTGKGTILLVEDDEQVKNFACAALKTFGYSVYTAQNGREALELVKKRNIMVDLLFTDMVMPDMNGNELSEKLKKLIPDIRVLFTSGYDANTSKKGALEKDINFLHKPYSINVLAKKVKEVI